MKTKTIKKTLKQKFDEWVETLPDTLKEKVRSNTIITGGSITSMLMKEPVNDFDIYFRDLETTHAVASYYVALFGKPEIQAQLVNKGGVNRVRIAVGKGYRGETVGNVEDIPQAAGEVEDTYDQLEKAAQETEDDADKPKYRPIFMSTNAITLSNKIQIVIRFYGNPEEIHANYDFVHCTCYWTSWNNELVLKLEALESMMAKELRYVGSKYPLCSILRCRKFIQRGWTINAGQMLKMIIQCNELDLTDPAILEDQLTGVDSAYFLELIHKLKEKDPTKVNTAYLVEIIDRIF
jgi:hypothetical protein